MMTRTKVYLLNTFSIITPIIGAVYVFYSTTLSRIDRMEDFHREDMVRIDERFIRMDKKWERLFEKLFDKEQENKVKI